MQAIRRQRSLFYVICFLESFKRYSYSTIQYDNYHRPLYEKNIKVNDSVCTEMLKVCEPYITKDINTGVKGITRATGLYLAHPEARFHFLDSFNSRPIRMSS